MILACYKCVLLTPFNMIVVRKIFPHITILSFESCDCYVMQVGRYVVTGFFLFTLLDINKFYLCQSFYKCHILLLFKMNRVFTECKNPIMLSLKTLISGEILWVSVQHRTYCHHVTYTVKMEHNVCSHLNLCVISKMCCEVFNLKDTKLLTCLIY